VRSVAQVKARLRLRQRHRGPPRRHRCQLRFRRPLRPGRNLLPLTPRALQDRGSPSLAVARLLARAHPMIQGLQQLVERCKLGGVRKNRITGRRVLLNRSTIGLENEPKLRKLQRRVRLVITSPPYPGVHVLYHRWQYRGRRETGAPYWIANLNDGQAESYYTFGNRNSTAGIDSYFNQLYMAFRSVRPFLSDNAVVVQLVSFGNSNAHLPRFLDAMEKAGYQEIQLSWDAAKRLRRRVPNRKWYTNFSVRDDPGSEILMIHRSKG
jgi:hypothetical protein